MTTEEAKVLATIKEIVDRLSPTGEEIYTPEELAQEFAEEIVRLRALLEQIFKWWDAHDGHLTTHYSHAVSRKMESLRPTANVADQRRSPE